MRGIRRMKVGVIINEHAASGRKAGAVALTRSCFEKAGPGTIVRLCRRTELTQVTLELLRQGCTAIAAGGGDGTLSTVAELCVREQIPLGVLPLGTHNHFAHDARLPLDIAESVRCILSERTRRVDLGSVNGHTFINNSSIGAYPRAVEARDDLRRHFGLRKYVAAMIGTLRVFSRKPEVDAVMEIDGVKVPGSGPFVFVGNNEYSVRMFSTQARQSLSGGKLCIYTARCNGVSGLMRLLWLALWDRLEQTRDFQMRTGESVTIHLRKAMVRVSKDGEVIRLPPPLVYRILPGALEIFSPE